MTNVTETGGVLNFIERLDFGKKLMPIPTSITVTKLD